MQNGLHGHTRIFISLGDQRGLGRMDEDRGYGVGEIAWY